MGHTAGLDAYGVRIISCPYRELKRSTFIVVIMRTTLYQLPLISRFFLSSLHISDTGLNAGIYGVSFWGYVTTQFWRQYRRDGTTSTKRVSENEVTDSLNMSLPCVHGTWISTWYTPNRDIVTTDISIFPTWARFIYRRVKNRSKMSAHELTACFTSASVANR
jgi:hypothetical protein